MIEKNFKKFFIDYNANTIDALKKINKLGGQSLIVTAKKNILVGILSSADIRKAIMSHNITNKNISKIYNRKPKFIYFDELQKKIKNIIYNISKLNIIPIIDRKTKKIVDVLNSEKANLLKIKKKKKLNMSVVIMAGGKGTRLLPYTSVLPKPLLPINQKPTIHHIIDRFMQHNIKFFFVTVNYKSGILKSYLNDLKKINSLSTIQEKTPLGTAGSLFLIKKKIKSDFFLTNCDTIINTNYSDIYSHHRIKKNDITIVTASKKFKVPYGVCHMEKNNFFMKEKPELLHNVNTGFYIISKECLKVKRLLGK